MTPSGTSENDDFNFFTYLLVNVLLSLPKIGVSYLRLRVGYVVPNTGS